MNYNITIHTVNDGESLFQISEKYYGVGQLWRIIYLDNKEVIGDDPNKIYAGQKIRIL